MAAFTEGMKKNDDGSGPSPEIKLPQRAVARVERTKADLPLFVGHIVPAFMAYVPDTDGLKALSDRLVLAAGRDSRGELPQCAVAALAERLGTGLRHFPGGRIGLTTHPAEFAEHLRDALGTR